MNHFEYVRSIRCIYRVSIIIIHSLITIASHFISIFNILYIYMLYQSFPVQCKIKRERKKEEKKIK